MAGSGNIAVRCVVHELVRCGTNPPFARAAIAGAENVRMSSAFIAANKPLSPMRSSDHVARHKKQTVLSLRSALTKRERTNQKNATAAGALQKKDQVHVRV